MTTVVNRFLTQRDYAVKKAFVLDILGGAAFGDAVRRHSLINISSTSYVCFNVGVFHTFMRFMKSALFCKSRNNTPETEAQYKTLNLFAHIDDIRSKVSLIEEYINQLEIEGNYRDRKTQNQTQVSESVVGVMGDSRDCPSRDHSCDCVRVPRQHLGQ